jgi:hypothetical protein
MIRFDMGPLIVTPAVATTIWEIFDSDLEPVKKLQSAALLLDFWLGQGVRAAAIPAAVLSRPSNAGQAKKTRNPVGESKKGRLSALPARLRPAAGMRRALACALPYGLSWSRAALSNFLGDPLHFAV